MSLSLELEPENPAVVYRESLSSGSYWAVRHSLETIARILGGEDADPWTFPWHRLTYQHTARVRREILARYAPETVNKMITMLRGVLKQAWRLGLMNHEDYARAADVDRVRVRPVHRVRAVTPEEIGALFAACAVDASAAGRRDAAILAVLYGGGLRRAELCGLDLADFQENERGLLVRKGKGRKGRKIYLNRQVCQYLAAWLRKRGHEPGPLFCPINSAGKVRLTRLRGETIWYLVGRRQREAGLEGISPHGMRRAFVTGLLEAGVDVFTVQKLAGHADTGPTARYDRRGEEAKREATEVLRLPLAP